MMVMYLACTSISSAAIAHFAQSVKELAYQAVS